VCGLPIKAVGEGAYGLRSPYGADLVSSAGLLQRQVLSPQVRLPQAGGQAAECPLAQNSMRWSQIQSLSKILTHTPFGIFVCIMRDKAVQLG